MTSFEYDYEHNVTLSGDIKETDGSFGHAFGTEKVTDYEVTNFKITVWADSTAYDISDLVLKQQPKEHEKYEEVLLERFLETIEKQVYLGF